MPSSPTSFASVRKALWPLCALAALLFAPKALAADGSWSTMPLDELRAVPGIDVVEVDFTGGRADEDGLAAFGKIPKPGLAKFPKADNVRAFGASRSADERQWMRHFPLVVTDKAFLDQSHVAVDVFVEYHLPTWAGVQIEVMREDGLKVARSGWGNTSNWRTLQAAADSVDFDGDGPHVRVVGANETLFVKRVRVIGYRGTGDDLYWPRLVRARELVAETADGIFAFPQGGAGASLSLENLARIDRPIDWRLRIASLDEEQSWHESSGTATVDASATTTVQTPFETSDWPLGPYYATLDVTIGERELLSLPIHLGVIDDGPRSLPRAQSDDEYWFGLDAANGNIIPFDNPLSMAYFDLMGVDIIRNIPGARERQIMPVDKARVGLAMLEERGMRSAYIAFPDNWRLDGAAFEEDRQKRIDGFANLAAEFAGTGPGQIAFFELGNEPDLPFFYGDSTEQYVESYHMAFDAIRAADPERGALVMNGGLCFHTDIGDRRAREIVSLINTDKLDVWAYHGHGPGVEAEREAYERQVHAVRDHASGDVEKALAKPYLETESGFNATNVAGIEEQARTAVEKQVYAMSEGMPSLYYFRLFMEGTLKTAGYGMTQKIDRGEHNQPLASVLTYRNLVRQLRNADFSRIVEAPDAGVEAYLFDGRSGSSERRTMVLFKTNPGVASLMLRLQDAAVAGDVSALDMYGNAIDVSRISPTEVTFEVSANPIYVSWDQAGDAAEVRFVEPLLALETSAPAVFVGGKTTLRVDVDALDGVQGTGRLEIETGSQTELTLDASSKPVRLDEPSQVTFEIESAQTLVPLQMPVQWLVFTDADAERVMDNPLLRQSIPSVLPGVESERVEGRTVSAEPGKRVDLNALAGARERRPAVVYAIIESPTDTSVNLGAAADWWMSWYVNGEPVYDTMETGNRHGTLADHQFSADLKKGVNVLCGVVLSGSSGFDFRFGGPNEVALAAGEPPVNRLSLRLVDSDGQTITQGTWPMQLIAPIPGLGDAKPGDSQSWEHLPPAAVLGADQVVNPNEKHPDTTRWYGGPDDLSATLWVRDDPLDSRVLVFAAVTDDHKHEGDAASIAIVSNDGAAPMEVDLQRAGNVDGRQVWLAELARSDLPAGGFRLFATITDDDGTFDGVEGPKQTIHLGDSGDFLSGLPLILSDAPPAAVSAN